MFPPSFVGPQSPLAGGVVSTWGIRLQTLLRALFYSGFPRALSPATIATGSTPIAVTMSPDDLYLYAVNNGSTGGTNNVTVYSRNRVTGVLSLVATQSLGMANPVIMVISTDGKNAYFNSSSATVLYQFSRDVATGLLSALPTASIAVPSTSWSLVMSPDGKFVYCACAGSTVIAQFARNPVTGMLAALPTATVATAAASYSIQITPDGYFAYAVNYGAGSTNTVSQYSRNPSTGQLTALNPATAGTGAGCYFMQVHPNGKFAYVCNYGTTTISQYRVAQSGQLVPLIPSTVTAAAGSGDMGWHPTGKFLCVPVTPTAPAVHTYEVDLSTGLLKKLSGTSPTLTGARGCAYSNDGRHLYVVSSTGNVVAQYSVQ